MTPGPPGQRSQPLGIRVDVDTHVGMRDGVPRLLEVFAATGARATFYLSMGPDRSGRALFNLFKPGFLAKMRRSSAVSVYGLRTVLSGTLLPSRLIALAFPEIARRIRDEGHETGVHAWDHRTWQDRLLRLPAAAVEEQLDRGRQAYRSIFGSAPASFAAPAWLSSDAALLHEDTFGLRFASDCRGCEPFVPIVAGWPLATPQVPTTLPTLDELIGWREPTAGEYFSTMLELAGRQAWPVLTVHAEIEGGEYAPDLEEFLVAAQRRGFRPVSLGQLLDERLASGPLAAAELRHAEVPGRHGVLSHQAGDAVGERVPA